MRRNRVGAIALVTVIASGLHAPVLHAGPIEDLQPGHWLRVPNSRLSSVLPSPLPVGDNRAGRPESIIDEWSSGAFDTLRDRLIVWGGGHNNYSGNELYAFNLNTLQWQRLTNPSANVGGTESSGYYPDGLPRSRHTYEYLDYVPSIDRFCSFGGAAQFPSGAYENESVHTDCFNFSTNQWETRRYKDIPRLPFESLVSGVSAYDPVTDRMYVHTSWVGEGPGLYRWRPATDGLDAWETLRRPSLFVDGFDLMTGEIDPERRAMLVIGSGRFLTVDLNNAAAGLVQAALGGDTAIQTVNAPGLAYDPVSKAIVGWRGGADVFLLTRSGSSWISTRRTPAPTNTVVPSAPNGNGTYGRFRYSPSKNVFVVVNSIHDDVYIYKLAAGGGTPSAPTLQFSDSTYSSPEAGGNATITVARAGSSAGAVSVNYATSNGTALAGADYTTASGVLRWADGDSASQIFFVPIINDTDIETNETVNLTLSNPTGGAVLSLANAVLTIVDDDGSSTFAFSRASYSVNESAGSTTITVVRSGDSSGTASVNYTTGNATAQAGADYTAASGTLTFGAGITSWTFTVAIINDTNVEGNEAVTLTLSNPSGAVLGSPSTAALAIIDDDGPATGVTEEKVQAGCALRSGSNIDPILPLLVLLALVQLHRRARYRRKFQLPRS